MNAVVVLIPYFKREDALRKTLSSLYGEVPEFDVLIVDDGSPVPLALETANYPFPIKIIRMDRNSGIEHALNTGLTEILSKNYEFVARLDTGDFWRPGRLTAERDFLLAHPDYGFVGSCASVLNADGTHAFDWNMPLTDQTIRRFVHFNSAFIHPSVMMRTSIIRQAGLYSDQFEAAEDYEYFLRLLKFGKAANLPEHWLAYEFGLPGQSISIDKRHQQIKSVIKAQIKYFDALNWRAYAGLIYKLIDLCMPKLAGLIKRHLRQLMI